MKALEAEMAVVKGERNARAKEKAEAEKAVEELKQQVSTRTAALEAERKERSAAEDLVKALKGELSGVKVECDAQARGKEEARKEVELTLLRLHQIQEELDHYFQLSRQQTHMLSSSENLSRRAIMLTKKMRQ